MFALRQKLLLGFGGLFLVIALIGIQGITKVTDLGDAIDVILRENYRSVIACQAMKESLERMDSGAQFILLGQGERGQGSDRQKRSGVREGAAGRTEQYHDPGRRRKGGPRSGAVCTLQSHDPQHRRRKHTARIAESDVFQ